jgi:hypothetical protein
MLLNGFWHEVHTNDFWTDIHLDLHALIEGDFAAATVAITFGALLGKVSPLQMIGIAFFELFFYSLNFYVSVPSHLTVLVLIVALYLCAPIFFSSKFLTQWDRLGL